MSRAPIHLILPVGRRGEIVEQRLGGRHTAVVHPHRIADVVRQQRSEGHYCVHCERVPEPHNMKSIELQQQRGPIEPIEPRCWHSSADGTRKVYDTVSNLLAENKKK